MTIDISVAGWRFYVNLDKPEPPKPEPAKTGPPHTLGTPMVVHPGPVGYHMTRASRGKLP